MLKLFLNTTDNFLSKSVKTIFERTEKNFSKENKKIDILNELNKLKDDPLGCVLGSNSPFEASVKIQIKVILGIFFVIVPLLGFSLLAYLSNIEMLYPILLTLIVAYLVASRMDEIIDRYVNGRAINVY